MEEAATEKGVVIKDDDGISSGSDDSDTLERMKAFSSSNQNRTSDTPRSVRRYDEYTSFLTRSQRAHMLGKEAPLSKDEESKRKVHFLPGQDGSDILEITHVLPELSHEDKQHCFMTAENWDSIDTDIELTRKRWENHLSGRLPFDRANNSLRGLESMLDPTSVDRSLVSRHETNIIQEANRQKRDKEFVHWQKLRHISLQTSLAEVERVQKLAQEDAEEAVACWETNKNQPLKVPAPRDDKKRSSNIFKKMFSGAKAGKK